MNKTSNYNLLKPSPEDFYNVENMNANMDIIDQELKNTNTTLKNYIDTHINEILPGVIVESGSNANGEYVRWGNGLQVCWRSRLTLPMMTIAQAYATWTFPATFLNTDYSVLITQAWIVSDATGRKPTIGLIQERTTSSCSVRLISKDSDMEDGESWGVHLVAIGRWKE